MANFQPFSPPRLPAAPTEYSQQYIDQLTNVLRLYFNQLSIVGPVNIGALNININTLPTQTSLSTLRSGDVYRDTTAGNVLKIKP
jgi:hypothetical protein